MNQIDVQRKENLICKIEQAYAKLKQVHGQGRFAPLFQVDEMIDEVEQIMALDTNKQHSEFLKHSNQQANIIVRIATNKIILGLND